MTVLPLRLGTLSAEGYDVVRSGIRWLCQDGQSCRRGEILGYCNIRLRPRGSSEGPEPFKDEARDFQVALVARNGGRFRPQADSSHGGWLDLMAYFHDSWSPDAIVGSLECRPGDLSEDGDTEGGLELLFVAGRRVSELADLRTGLLSGWHDRSRAWWGEHDGPMGTLLSLGLCDLVGVIRGDRMPFAEFLGPVRGPAHAVYFANEASMPCALVVQEQARRTPADTKAIANDLSRSLQSDSDLTSADFIFAGYLLGSLKQSPVTEGFDILRRSGLGRTGPPDAILMSLNAEPSTYLRHRRLGYALHIAEHRIVDAGPAIRNWLISDFEVVRRSMDDIRRDYEALFRLRPDAAFLIMNAVSTTGNEDIFNYTAFDSPMGDTLSYIRAKELNLMLHDLTHDNNVSIIDVDAIAADIGIAGHVPDGVHPSGPMQAEVRATILHALRECRIPGFTNSTVR